MQEAGKSVGIQYGSPATDQIEEAYKGRLGDYVLAGCQYGKLARHPRSGEASLPDTYRWKDDIDGLPAEITKRGGNGSKSSWLVDRDHRRGVV